MQKRVNPSQLVPTQAPVCHTKAEFLELTAVKYPSPWGRLAYTILGRKSASKLRLRVHVTSPEHLFAGDVVEDMHFGRWITRTASVEATCLARIFSEDGEGGQSIDPYSKGYRFRFFYENIDTPLDVYVFCTYHPQGPVVDNINIYSDQRRVSKPDFPFVSVVDARTRDVTKGDETFFILLAYAVDHVRELDPTFVRFC